MRNLRCPLSCRLSKVAVSTIADRSYESTHTLARYPGLPNGHMLGLCATELIGGQIEQTPYRWDVAGFWIHDVLWFRASLAHS